MTEVLLELSGVDVAYQKGIRALHDLSIEVRRGEIVALLGANGAGKTTVQRTVSGLLGLHRGRVERGAIRLDGHDITRAPSHERGRRGVAQVPEGRRIFAGLTVEENLLVTAGRHAPRFRPAEGRRSLDLAYDVFPVLRERRTQLGGLLSGGEQQMLAIGRALLAQPQILCIDELSLGLAPQAVTFVFERLAHLNRELGLTVLLIEQNARMALRYAHRAYVLAVGSVVLAGDAAELQTGDALTAAYLGSATT